VKDEILGVFIIIVDKSIKKFSRRELVFAEEIALQTSFAIKNSQLYQELHEKVKELERFTRVSVDRELKMMELKERIEELEKRLKAKNVQ
ncbi:MAG: hypothetical protein ACE5QV_03745, partial [Fidelibacterota bacterium]